MAEVILLRGAVWRPPQSSLLNNQSPDHTTTETLSANARLLAQPSPNHHAPAMEPPPPARIAGGRARDHNLGPARTVGNSAKSLCSSSLITSKEDTKDDCCNFLLNYECVLNALQAHHLQVFATKRIICPVQATKKAANQNWFGRGRPRASQEARWRGALAQLQLSDGRLCQGHRMNRARTLGVVDREKGCGTLSKNAANPPHARFSMKCRQPPGHGQPSRRSSFIKSLSPTILSSEQPRS